MKKFVSAILLIVFGCSNLWAREGVSIATGYGAARIIPIRIGIQKEFEKKWKTESDWPIGGYWEGSIYTMNSKRQVPQSNKRVDACAIAGVFRFERVDDIKIGWPYVELGIGLSWLSRKKIADRDLGMHFQFEDRIGLGIRFGENREYDVGYKAIHFSNAYIGPSNHGINLHILALGYWF